MLALRRGLTNKEWGYHLSPIIAIRLITCSTCYCRRYKIGRLSSAIFDHVESWQGFIIYRSTYRNTGDDGAAKTATVQLQKMRAPACYPCPSSSRSLTPNKQP